MGGEPGGGRRQASIALQTGDGDWTLINATPDVAAQVNRTPELRPGPGLRETPISRVLLTDAGLDHVLGLFELRQGERLEVVGTRNVLTAVRDGLGIGRSLGAYLPVRWTTIELGEPVPIGGTTVSAVDAGGLAPRYVGGARTATEGARGWSVAWEIDLGGRTFVYAPVVGAIGDRLADACSCAACVLFDGTFLSDDEPMAFGVGRRSAREMGHVPIAGPDGSLVSMSAWAGAARAYTHLNHTNPILRPDGPERRRLEEAGVGVAAEGDVFGGARVEAP